MGDAPASAGMPADVALDATQPTQTGTAVAAPAGQDIPRTPAAAAANAIANAGILDRTLAPPGA